MTDASDTGVIRLSNAEQFIEQSVSLLSQTIRTVHIITDTLDFPWLGNEDVIDAIKAAVIKNRRVHVRILVTETKQAVSLGHPLLNLIKRLSRIEARLIEPEILDKEPLKHGYLLVDRGGVALRQSLDSYVGFAHHNDKPTVKRLTDRFDQYWRYSKTSPELRFVYL